MGNYDTVSAASSMTPSALLATPFFFELSALMNSCLTQNCLHTFSKSPPKNLPPPPVVRSRNLYTQRAHHYHGIASKNFFKASAALGLRFRSMYPSTAGEIIFHYHGIPLTQRRRCSLIVTQIKLLCRAWFGTVRHWLTVLFRQFLTSRGSQLPYKIYTERFRSLSQEWFIRMTMHVVEHVDVSSSLTRGDATGS